MICDFCTAPDPAWEYPAVDVDLPATRSLGPWVACDDCRALIDAREWEQLASRSKAAVPSEPLELIRETHLRFRSACRGRARPVQVTPMHGRIFER